MRAGPAINAADLKAAMLRYARYSLGGEWAALTQRERFIAFSLAVREPVIDAMLETERRAAISGVKRVYYLSMEFLAGRVLGNNLLNLGLMDAASGALAELGDDLNALEDVEPDPALGNGGLGRLAACFLDSMATLGIHGYGCGINYEFGLFRQRFDDGFQHELPDEWRSRGTPWLLHRYDKARVVHLYGSVERAADRSPRERSAWTNTLIVTGVPADLPIVGYGGTTVNYLRLYSAQASEEFDMGIFNTGDYVDAVRGKIDSERISKVLYPSDDTEAGRELRIIQEYFFVACSLADILERHAPENADLHSLPDRVAIQLNDTHPALAVAELIRLLVDTRDVGWDDAVAITRRACAYTNHTLLPEALERWPVLLLQHVLPRPLEIIEQLNKDHMAEVAAALGDDNDGRANRVTIIESGDDPHVRMGHLAVAGSHAINGVSELHSRLVRTDLFPDFAATARVHFQNKTNGVTQRRWMVRTNPELTALICGSIGDAWILDLDRLRELEDRADDGGFLTELAAIKRLHKERLAARIYPLCGVHVDPASLYDVHIKRFHEYKRQLMNALRVVVEYLRLIDDGVAPAVPRTFIFGGKAAPGYARAKQIIKLINELARVINSDPRAAGHMKVAFLPDYRVTLAERIIPAADLSEQISTAGMEASGTGNMKFMMNGALTVGTLDGANIEMAEEAGRENLFIFGLTAEEVAEKRRIGYAPAELLKAHPEIDRALAALTSKRFHDDAPRLFRDIVHDLRNRDYYLVLADLPAFLEAQAAISNQFQDAVGWQRKCLLNIARSGRFSSDRTIREYARDIWGLS